MVRAVNAHAAVAGQTATAPMWWSNGRRAALPSDRPAIAYMPSGNTNTQPLVPYRGLVGRGSRARVSAASNGISQVARAQAAMPPSASAGPAAGTAVAAMGTIRAAAKALMETAPMATQ